MFRFLSVNTQGRFRERNNQPRVSCDRQCPSPFSDESSPDENRYYRSAEFQQALLQRDNDYSSLFDHETSWEEIGRRARYERRRSTIVSHIPFYQPRASDDNATEPEILPASNQRASRRWSTYTLGTSGTSSSRNSMLNEAESTRARKKANRASVWVMEGVGHLVPFSKNKKLDE